MDKKTKGKMTLLGKISWAIIIACLMIGASVASLYSWNGPPITELFYTPASVIQPTPTPTVVPTPEVSDVSLAGGIVELTNQARRSGASCGPYPPKWGAHDYAPGAQRLHVDRRLSESAQAHAEYMARTGDYRHQSIDAIVAAGGMSENIAWIGPFIFYQSDGTIVEVRPESEDAVPGRFTQGWLDSPGHCHNMMQPQWGIIGVGVALSESGEWYGVQMFSR